MNLWFSKAYKHFKSYPEMVNVNVVDNRAHWVYDGVIYYANVVDDKIDNATIRKIKI